MPGYTTHLTWSSTLGVGLGLAAKMGYNAPLSEALFGGFLCAIGGILPDIDSDKSTAHKRCMSIISSSIALLLACRLRDFMLRPETVLLVSATVYFVLFYGAGRIIQALSVHRGMCHSIPFAVICGELVFIMSSGSPQVRFFKTACVFFGVLIHLILDELSSARLISDASSSSRSSYSNSGYYGSNTDYNNGSNYYRGSSKSKKKTKRSSGLVKKSFGTALKLIDYKHLGSTIFFYCVAVVLGHAAMNVQNMLSQLGDANISELRGKAAVDRIKATYPTQFDLSVVQWVAENDLVLSPGTDDNIKWHSLQELLSLSSDSTDKEASTDAVAEQEISLLDVVNWNSMNTPNPENRDATIQQN